MNATCPVCKKPCIAAELHAYGKCEDCYSPAPAAGPLEQLGRESRDVTVNALRGHLDPMPKTEFEHGCGGGHRVIRTTRGLS